MGLARRGDEAWESIEAELREGKMRMTTLTGVGFLSFEEVEEYKRAVSHGWRGTPEQKRLWAELKRREKELVLEGKEGGFKGYLRRRQLQDAELRPDRRMQEWRAGGAVSTQRSRRNPLMG